jgi:hypothetical protein
MKLLAAILLLLAAALCMVGYIRTGGDPKAAGMRFGFLFGTMVTSGMSWLLLRNVRLVTNRSLPSAPDLDAPQECDRSAREKE